MATLRALHHYGDGGTWSGMDTTRDFDLVEPLIGETWVVDGKVAASPPGEIDALYIRPMLHQWGSVPSGSKVLHSLVLDNNVLTDMVEGRRSANTDYLENLLRSKPLELNPVMAMLEQRQKFGGASQALHDFAELLGQRFGAWAAKQNAGYLNLSEFLCLRHNVIPERNGYAKEETETPAAPCC